MSKVAATDASKSSPPPSGKSFIHKHDLTWGVNEEFNCSVCNKHVEEGEERRCSAYCTKCKYASGTPVNYYECKTCAANSDRYMPGEDEKTQIERVRKSKDAHGEHAQFGWKWASVDHLFCSVCHEHKFNGYIARQCSKCGYHLCKECYFKHPKFKASNEEKKEDADNEGKEVKRIQDEKNAREEKERQRQAEAKAKEEAVRKALMAEPARRRTCLYWHKTACSSKDVCQDLTELYSAGFQFITSHLSPEKDNTWIVFYFTHPNINGKAVQELFDRFHERLRARKERGYSNIDAQILSVD